jgi:hypothetical protein
MAGGNGSGGTGTGAGGEGCGPGGGSGRGGAVGCSGGTGSGKSGPGRIGPEASQLAKPVRVPVVCGDKKMVVITQVRGPTVIWLVRFTNPSYLADAKRFLDAFSIPIDHKRPLFKITIQSNALVGQIAIIICSTQLLSSCLSSGCSVSRSTSPAV